MADSEVAMHTDEDRQVDTRREARLCQRVEPHDELRAQSRPTTAAPRELLRDARTTPELCVDRRREDEEGRDEDKQVADTQGQEEPIHRLRSHLEDKEERDAPYLFVAEDSNVDGVGDDSEEVSDRHEERSEEQLHLREGLATLAGLNRALPCRETLTAISSPSLPMDMAGTVPTALLNTCNTFLSKSSVSTNSGLSPIIGASCTLREVKKMLL